MTATEQPLQEERLSAYVAKLQQMKESRAVREILERELLLEFIRLNQSRINEFPLIETQQRSISELFTLRGLEDPLYEHVKAIIGNFIQTLNRYGKALENSDEDSRRSLIPDLSNLEVLLVKCIQGVVYITALTLDNVAETLATYFGDDAYKAIDDITVQEELGVRFWQRHIEHFIGKTVESAFVKMVSEERFTLRKEGNMLAMTYRFDDLLSYLGATPAPPDKSRIQQQFENQEADFETRKNRKLVLDYLRAEFSDTGKGFSTTDIGHIGQLVCIDPSSRQLSAALTFLHTGIQPEGMELTREQAVFITEQVQALASGMAIGLNVMREDFLRAPQMFSAKEINAIRNMLGPFDLNGLHRVLGFMLESQFMAILRQRFGEDAGKMQVRSLRERRVAASQVLALEDLGMNRIRRNKLWRQDPDANDYMLFQMHTVQELQRLLQLFQMESPLVRAVAKLWETARFKLEIKVGINLDLLSRTTTNLNQKLAEILSRFGISSL
ncbi:hypothetical protein [Oleidesulfovibrio sp.]|uniref:hypothetical protein n=1 Tax=Oleidesulfovibrio sp. TaxID=2909707 RepID=UPI003A84FC81